MAGPMALDGDMIRRLRDALIAAFPSHQKLRAMTTMRLNRNLAALAKEGGLEDVAFELIERAESEGWLEELVTGAMAANPGNELLREVGAETLAAIQAKRELQAKREPEHAVTAS